MLPNSRTKKTAIAIAQLSGFPHFEHAAILFAGLPTQQHAGLIVPDRLQFLRGAGMGSSRMRSTVRKFCVATMAIMRMPRQPGAQEKTGKSAKVHVSSNSTAWFFI